MDDKEQCKAQADTCRRLFDKDIDRIMDRFNSTDKALKLQQAEMERRMSEGNNIKHEFSDKINDLNIQASNI